jgi:hypothetical protein
LKFIIEINNFVSRQGAEAQRKQISAALRLCAQQFTLAEF